MRMPLPDFNGADETSTGESFYDIREDWALIEASMATQYGIRIRQVAKTMTWSEFCTLIGGLMPDTPLGSIVGIRAEKDSKTIKSFSPEQKKINSDWKKRMAKIQEANPEALAKSMKELEHMLEQMFGGGTK